jgi:hypothetical protein
MIHRPCDADQSHTGRSQLSVQGSPQARQAAILTLEPERTSLKGQLPVLEPAASGCSHQALQLLEAHAPEKGLMRAMAFAQSSDQPSKDHLALVLIEPLDIANGIDEGVDAAQPVQVPLPVGSGMAGHGAPSGQGRAGHSAGEGGSDL